MPEFICSSCGNSFGAEPDEHGNITCPSCRQVMSEETAERPLAAGTRVGGYEIIRHIASGGTGSVYLAEQIAMERSVALKILNQDQVASGNAERFLNEARNTAKFENQHVVSVIDSGITPEGFYYIAMQYVEGETLEEILERGRVFSEEETLLTGLTVAEALKSIWNKYKMFHKDIKPGNIMLTPENEAMILDMGTAQERGESRLADGNIEGSPYFMSPEQARGEELTWSTDLYSLGATMYQMVTGKYLYEGLDVESILHQHDSAPFPDPAVRMPELHISTRMTDILRKMVEKKASDRYASWNDFIRDAKNLLETLLDRKGSAAPRNLRKQLTGMNPSAGPRTPKRRTAPTPGRFICYGLIIFILAVALLGGIFMYLAVRKNSGNARTLLGPILKQVNSLEMDPDAVDEALRNAEPYFRRMGVLPSLRHEFENCRLKVNEFRELSRKEGEKIARLESRTAEQLQAAEEASDKAERSLQDQKPHQAKAHYENGLKLLRKMAAEIKKEKFVLQQNIDRAGELRKRLETAQLTIRRDLRQFHKPPPRPKKTAAGKTGTDKKKNTAADPSRKKKAAPRKKASAAKQDAVKAKLKREMDICRIMVLEKPAARNEKQILKELQGKADVLPSPWRKGLEETVKDAAKIWQTVFNSHQKFAGFKFTVRTDSGDTLMELKTILRDNVILYHPGMQNVRLRFSELPDAEWLDFLRHAAKKTDLEKKLDSFLLLEGWFTQVKKSKNTFIRKEMPQMRQVYYRYLSGDKIPGTDPRQGEISPVLLRKLKTDPDFASFLAKMRQRKSDPQPPETKERKK